SNAKFAHSDAGRTRGRSRAEKVSRRTKLRDGQDDTGLSARRRSRETGVGGGRRSVDHSLHHRGLEIVEERSNRRLREQNRNEALSRRNPEMRAVGAAPAEAAL